MFQIKKSQKHPLALWYSQNMIIPTTKKLLIISCQASNQSQRKTHRLFSLALHTFRIHLLYCFHQLLRILQHVGISQVRIKKIHFFQKIYSSSTRQQRNLKYLWINLRLLIQALLLHRSFRRLVTLPQMHSIFKWNACRIGLSLSAIKKRISKHTLRISIKKSRISLELSFRLVR